MLTNLLASRPDLGLFLDVDGTLLEFAATPHAVDVPAHLIELLYRLSAQSDGAVALVSGRSLDDLDRLFAPHRFSGAGVHGCELRQPDGRLITPSVDGEAIKTLHEQVGDFDDEIPGVLIEYKPYGAAIHYRLCPEAEHSVLAYAQAVLARCATGFTLQRGKYVYEIKLAAYTKGSAIRALMELPPFRGRQAVFIGDDVTDEDGFEAVNLVGGISVRVGESRPTLANHRLPNVAAVHRLLSDWVNGAASTGE
jgi:trehalose 6-phosphate phosphatase